jgi:hypothetical protein
MSNIYNQTQNLFALDTVQDLDNETAATCSGGVAYFNGPSPDVILYEHADFKGRSIGVNASTGDGLNLTDANDTVSSAVILRGVWHFYEDVNFNSGGTYGHIQGDKPLDFGGTPVNDTISSIKRVG